MPTMHSKVAILAAVAGTCVPFAASEAQELTQRSDGSAVYTWDGSRPIDGENHLITSIPSTFTGADVATIIGANTFYAHGYDGAGTISSNIEAGHIWNGHEALGHVTSRTNHATAPGAGYVTPAYDRHATWVGLMIGGRLHPTFPFPEQTGIAYGTDLRSGAIATIWAGARYAGGFSTTADALAMPYVSGVSGFGTANVINSSWGGQGLPNSVEAAGTDIRALITDSLANQNRFTTFVASAGNDGATANPRVGSPASGYNDITVGALVNDGSNNYNAVANFSSRGPQEYADPTNGMIASATARRAVVDIVAPGTNLTSAYYGGQSGGNDPALGGSPGGSAGGPDFYSGGVQGTSFSAPIVAGSVALMHHAATGENLPADARDTRVIRANLLNAARKISGWNNGQAAHPNGNGGVRTTQALDFDSGAGALDLTRTYDQYLTGQTDLPGTAGGITTEAIGWDFGLVGVGDSTDIVIDTLLEGGSEFRVTLAWFRDRTYANSLSQTDVGMANRNLEVWDSTFTTLIADSVSQYNTVEHLAFTLPEEAGLYGLRIAYPDELFGTLPSEEYGIAWWGTEAVPEPASLAFLALAGVAALRRRGRR